MKKIIFGIVVVVVLVIVSLLIFKNYPRPDKLNESNNETFNNTVNNEITVSSVEVKKNNDATHDGGVYVTFANGNTKKIAQSKGPQDVAEIYDIISYRKAFISLDHKYVAVEATGFEESFVEVYEVSTDVLHKRTHGVVTRWTNDGFLEVKSCDLSGEECNNKISISSNKPWLFKQQQGVSVGNDVLLDSTDFISNIKKSDDLSIFTKMLEVAGPEAIKGTGLFTVFVPNNEAFEALPAGTVDNLFKTKSKQQLIDLIRNHIVANEYNIVEIENGMKLNTIGNDTLLFTTNDWSYVKINGNSIVTIPNIYSTNGVIHVVTKVLLP